MKYLILLSTVIFFSISNAQACPSHYDAFLNRLNSNVSAPSYNLIKNNIKTFRFEAHYKNKNNKLDKQLKNILSADKFDKAAYTNVMKKIHTKSDKENISASADLISQLNQHDRIELYKAMTTNNS